MAASEARSRTRKGASSLGGRRRPSQRDQHQGERLGRPRRRFRFPFLKVGRYEIGVRTRNRTFFFANVEQRDRTQSGLATILPANVDTINARLAATGYSGSPIVTGTDSNPLHSTVGLAKIDHHAGSHQMGLRYTLYRVTSDDARGAGGLSAPSAGAGLDNIDHAVAFSDPWALSGQTVNETRIQFAHGALKAPNADPVGPQVNISGVASFGRFSQPTERISKLVEVVDTLSHQTGAHALRAGVDFLYNDTTITFPRAAHPCRRLRPRGRPVRRVARACRRRPSPRARHRGPQPHRR